ncbi:MAG: gamma-glutamyltransferase [Hyphomicrobiaceae bacterium]
MPSLLRRGSARAQGVWRARVLAGAVALLSLAGALPAAAQTRAAPERETGRTEKPLVRSARYMVSAANPLAVEAGLEMLRAGGNAVDAAIAVQLVLNLVEPQSSGIGGGAFILFWDQKARQLRTYDGRETAPAAARPERFLKADDRPMPLREAIFSGSSVGVPGLVAVMALTHKQHGRLPWARLFAPAIRLAEEGFQVSPRLHVLLRWIGPTGFSPRARRYFFDADGSARTIGSRLKNPEFARTLREIATGGEAAFYRGRIAREIVAAVRGAARHPGDMTEADVAAYRARERPPVCIAYRQRRVCGMGPPSSGGLTVAMALKLVEPFELGRRPLDVRGVHVLTEAQKLAYADRDRYMADADVVPVPVSGLLDPAYLDSRRRLIRPLRAGPKASPGRPPGVGIPPGRDGTRERKGTSHISIVDADGNAVSMTTTIEGAFGSRQWAAGFLLNNELTDFSLRPRDADGRPIANRVQGGKRPRSSMAPTIVFDAKGEVEAVLGSPGGSRIILYVLKSLVALIDWGMDAQAAAALVNFGSRNGPFEVEHGRDGPWLALKMRALGHEVTPSFLVSGTHIVVRRGGRLEGGADPRREGVARGE